MFSEELLAKFVLKPQACLGIAQVLTFFIFGTWVYARIDEHDKNWMGRDFTCKNASDDDDKNRCMEAYSTMELHPLQSGLWVPSLWYFGSLVIWFLSGVAILRWFKKYVSCETRQRHKGCFEKFHIGVVYFLGIVFRLLYFLAMCAVYGFYHNNWVVSSNYHCKLSPKIYISCFYSKAKKRTDLNKASFGIIVSFLILAFLELLYMCRDNYRHKYESKGITEALRCEECAYFAKRHLILLKPESKDAKNDTKTPLIDPEQTVEHQDTAFDGPQQPGRNYNPTEEKSEKGQPCESDEKASSSHPEDTEKSHVATTSSNHGSDNDHIHDQQLTERTTLLRGDDGQKASWDPAIVTHCYSASPCIPDSANSDCKDSGPLIPKKDSPLSDTKSASPKSFPKSETPTREDLSEDATGASQDSYRQDGGPKGTKDQSGENVRPSNSANDSSSKSNSKKDGQSKSGFNGKAMEKVDRKTLNYVAEQIASDWKKLGIELEVPYHVIEQIECDNRKCYDQSYAMLSNWLQRRGDDATRHELLTALITCGRKYIADNIGRKTYS